MRGVFCIGVGEARGVVGGGWLVNAAAPLRGPWCRSSRGEARSQGAGSGEEEGVGGSASLERLPVRLLCVGAAARRGAPRPVGMAAAFTSQLPPTCSFSPGDQQQLSYDGTRVQCGHYGREDGDARAGFEYLRGV